MKKRMAKDQGVSLIETMIAVLISLIGVFGLAQVVFLSMVQNKNQGAEVTRATIYAQDKIEKLLSLDYASCTQSPSSQPATCNTTNISAGNWTMGLYAGGQVTPVVADCPTSGNSVGYIDFLDTNGLQVPGATPATSCAAIASSAVSYIRMWQVTTLASTGGPEMREIMVSVYAQSAVSAPGGKPIVQLTSYISNPN
jgi:Tfp pilus assembly protein PilV